MRTFSWHAVVECFIVRYVTVYSRFCASASGHLGGHCRFTSHLVTGNARCQLQSAPHTAFPIFEIVLAYLAPGFSVSGMSCREYHFGTQKKCRQGDKAFVA